MVASMCLQKAASDMGSPSAVTGRRRSRLRMSLGCAGAQTLAASITSARPARFLDDDVEAPPCGLPGVHIHTHTHTHTH